MSDPTSKPVVASFRDLNLAAPLLQALEEVGYETPSPIQAEAIPYLLNGLDLLGHAPTGTGKTAAFALPLLSRIDMLNQDVQIMTLTPTRELAIQVAEAFQRYASHMKGFHVLPIYGGQDYTVQIQGLKRGVHVVVGTPGRVMDHMRRGTLKLGGLKALVLDEADEMLRMGFIDEVEWILEQTPAKRQMALFSATMPRQIERIARKYLNNPQEVSIKSKTATAETIRQRYWLVSGFHKLDAFTRILEVEEFDAMLVFVRTKSGTAELAERLAARGYTAAAMNGDMAQKDRERMVDRLKKGSLDILVATDVAARGLDVDRISHVINYDIPYDAEAYIHRIGRTGRAGRKGEAILFVAPRERRMLAMIEKATRQKITPLELPTTEIVNNKRIADFKQKISDTLAAGELAFMQGLIEQYQQEHDVTAVEIAAALAQLSIGDKPLLMAPDKDRPRKDTDTNRDRPGRSAELNRRDDSRPSRKDRGDRPDRKEGYKNSRQESDTPRRSRPHTPPDSDKERFRIEVGYDHDVKPGNIVGAIANEAGLDGDHIGQIEISDQYSLVDLPRGMPSEVFNDLKKVWVCGQQLKISRLDGSEQGAPRRDGPGKPDRKFGPKKPGGARPGANKKIDFKADNNRHGGKGKPGENKPARFKPDDSKSGGARPGANKKVDFEEDNNRHGSKGKSGAPKPAGFKADDRKQSGGKAKGKDNAGPKKNKKKNKNKSKPKRNKDKGKPAPGKRAGAKKT